MKYKKVLNPKWANAEHTAINCDVDFEGLNDDLISFTAVALGDYEHSHKIFSECLNGNYGAIAEYVPPPPPTAEQIKAEEVAQAKSELLQIDLSSIRSIREYIASKTDAQQILKDKEKAAIEKRKALKNG
jgi:hypothetical protein